MRIPIVTIVVQKSLTDVLEGSGIIGLLVCGFIKHGGSWGGECSIF